MDLLLDQVVLEQILIQLGHLQHLQDQVVIMQAEAEADLYLLTEVMAELAELAEAEQVRVDNQQKAHQQLEAVELKTQEAVAAEAVMVLLEDLEDLVL